mgnify:CR=1 FL=1
MNAADLFLLLTALVFSEIKEPKTSEKPKNRSKSIGKSCLFSV